MMKKFLLLSSLLVSTLVANAQVTPKVQPERPVSGNKYVLVNKAQTPTQYMSRTSWDGALYFLGESDSHYADYALTAIQNADGTWAFSLPNADNPEETLYMGVPGGSPNLNVTSTEPVLWTLDPKEGNFYNLILGEGNNGSALAQAPFTPTKDIRLHLNNGSQYFVATYYTGPWYPDCVGGVTEVEDESTGDLYFSANDSTSFNWGFVSVENIPAYMADMKVSKTINDFYENYCDYAGYEAGFSLTADAAAALYNSVDYNEDDAEIISAMLTTKITLYEEIEAAMLLNETDDAVLAAAVETALDLFNKNTDTNALASAVETLKQAELNYSMGNGDVTSLGKNMSFEDLSAQGGSTTTGVAGAPAGWNVYVNGELCVTADDVRNAGISAWHGVNADCNGDVKDGNYGFGLWVGSVPQYEISQTITGLDNGTYIITAGLMVGANGSGSRRTTQRVFGNLNSTYFGFEEDYNTSLLDNSEVYAFAGNFEPQTDTELQPIEVSAFVYDGTLTFGLRTDGNIAAANRTSSNGAGGDGWFKLDNFRIQKVGYVPEDAIAVYEHYTNILGEYSAANEPMSATLMEELNDRVDNMQELTETNTVEEFAAAILSAKDFLVTVDNSVKAYQKLNDAIEQHYGYLEQYSTKMGADEYSDVIAEAEEAYTDGTAADEAAIDSIIAGLNTALQACIQSDEIEEGSDLTDYIQNPSFEDLSAQGNSGSGGVANAPKGWNLYINGELTNTAAEIRRAGVENWCAINTGDNISVELENGTTVTRQPSDGDNLWGIWTGSIPEVELSQTLGNMPAGTYTLTCDVLVQYNWAGYCITTQRIFANDYVAMYSYEGNYENNLPGDAQIAAEIDELSAATDVPHLVYAGYECEAPRSDYSHTVSLTFGLAEAGDIKIGFRTNNIDRDGVAQGSGKGWFKLDNWRLTYDSAEIPTGADIDALATDVQTLDAAACQPVAFYTIGGTPLQAPQQGVNLVRYADGTVRKIFIK